MEKKQARLVSGLMALVICLWIAALGFSPRIDRHQLPVDTLFDASRALDQSREFVVRYPRRVLGSIESRQSTGYLREKLAQLGYQISYSHFDATIAGHRQVGRNVLAFRPGPNPEIVAAIAHYDTAPTTFEGAMDDGSGIGVLLELARVFSAQPPQRSQLFIASDGEEWGLLGALDLAQNYPERRRIVAVLSLDHVSIHDLAAFEVGTAGQFGGYTPPWLRDLVRLALSPERLPVEEASGLEEHRQRALGIAMNDQGPFLKAGIPAVNLGSRSADVAREQAIYHSELDRMENLKLSGFQTYGRGAERILRTLSAMPGGHVDSMGDLRVMGSKYLPAWAMRLLHWALFLPYVVMVWFHLLNHGKYLGFQRLQRELIASGVSLFLFVLAYFYILLCWALRLIPRYSLYPATAKDPILMHPAWGVLAGAPAIIICGLVGVYFLIKFLSRDMVRPDFCVSKLILLLFLMAVIFLALIYNSYWAAVFLALPAWVWGLLSPGVGPGGRAANRILILAAVIPCCLIVVYSAAELAPGSNLLWAGAIALSAGTFGLGSYMLCAVTLILGFRFLVIQSQAGID